MTAVDVSPHQDSRIVFPLVFPCISGLIATSFGQTGFLYASLSGDVFLSALAVVFGTGMMRPESTTLFYESAGMQNHVEGHQERISSLQSMERKEYCP